MSYLGQVSVDELLGIGNSRFFYGLRREDDGTLLFTKVDQMSSSASISINVAGNNINNFENFEYGVDFFDGRLATDHSRPYTNLYFDQYRWDNKNSYYYIDNQGNLVVRINSTYVYTNEQIVSAI
jgi:hypothetical protein